MMKHFFILFLVFLVSLPAYAQKPYVVENVKINMKGVSPVEARDQALNAAQIKAFKALFKSLNKGTDLPFEEERVASLVDDFELIDEQIAPNRYAATYTFRFNRLASEEFAREAQYASGVDMSDPNAAYNPNNTYYSDLFSQQKNAKIKYPAAYKPPLLLPYWKIGENVVIWGQNNAWRNTWKRIETKTENGRGFILPIGDLSDMRETSGRLPENRNTIGQLLARYQTDRIVVAVGERAVSSITTTLYKADDSGLTFWKVIDSPIGPSTDPYSVAAGQVMAEIRGNSNPANSSRIPENVRNDVYVPEPNEPEPFFQGANNSIIETTIRAKSRFATPKEWLDLKSKMTPENGIRQIRVLSLTPKSAMVEMQLSQPLQNVQRNLGDRNVALKQYNGPDGQYIIQFIGL